MANPSVTHVHLLAEDESALTSAVTAMGRPLSDKLIGVVVGERLKFSRAFAYAARHLAGHTCAVANADLYFDQASLQASLSRLKQDTVYALLRWDVLPDRSSVLRPRTDSQDAWVFASPLRVAPHATAFQIGRLRSDNRLAAALQDAGYRVINNPWQIKTLHLHVEQARPGRTNLEQVPGRFTNLPLGFGY